MHQRVPESRGHPMVIYDSKRATGQKSMVSSPPKGNCIPHLDHQIAIPYTIHIKLGTTFINIPLYYNYTIWIIITIPSFINEHVPNLTSDQHVLSLVQVCQKNGGCPALKTAITLRQTM